MMHRDPFDHHDPEYDENWLRDNIDNPQYQRDYGNE
jgi:hypothetical protein